jgi:hypothetical protein
MSDFLGRFPSLDSLAAMPVWIAGAVAAIIVVACLLAFSRAGRERMVGGVNRIGLIIIGAAITWILLDGSARRDLAAERRALDARATDLMVRATLPGSALACLNGAAGEAVEASCEKALFATPEGTAAAASFVSAQLTLLADATDFARREPTYAAIPAQLRHAAETDRFGFVAHILAMRDACTPDHCDAFALLNDASRVSTNLAEQPYDLFVARYAAGWPATTEAPVATGTPASPPPALASAPAPAPGIGLRVPGPNVFFPSAASIPPVSIMSAEPTPAHPAETTGSTPVPKAAPAQRKAAAPVRRPAAEPAPVDISPNGQHAAPPPSVQ